jgi:4-amino-4-deoxy-L-arabinose transferase-like glycosyltransferase
MTGAVVGREGRRADAPPAFARGPVAVVAAAVVALLLAVGRRYGWHRDELYFLAAGRHLAWGYVDQPPFTPFVARVADVVAPDNLVVLRTLPALAGGCCVAVGALLARELGGDRRAQVLGAGALAGGFTLGVSHLLATATFDLLAWLTLLWLAARLLRTGEPRWWVAFGAIAGLSALNKDLGPLLGVSLGAGLLIERRWDLLRSWWLAAGAGLALVVAAPNLVWQATNGWPQLEMGRVLADRLAGENRTTLLPLQLLFVGPLVAWLLWRGARWLGGNPRGRPFRALLWAWPTGLVVTFASAGRPYYVLPLTMFVLLAGIVASEQRGRVRAVAVCVVLNVVTTVPLALPILPVSTLSGGENGLANQAVEETVGWPELADQVAGVVRTLPAAEQQHVMLLTGSYGEAGALDRFGPARGLPPAYSPHNSYWYFRQPTDDDATVVAVRFSVGRLQPFFDRCEQVGTVDNGLDIANEVQGAPIVVCRGLRGSWREVWLQLRFLS